MWFLSLVLYDLIVKRSVIQWKNKHHRLSPEIIFWVTLRSHNLKKQQRHLCLQPVFPCDRFCYYCKKTGLIRIILDSIRWKIIWLLWKQAPVRRVYFVITDPLLAHVGLLILKSVDSWLTWCILFWKSTLCLNLV